VHSVSLRVWQSATPDEFHLYEYSQPGGMIALVDSGALGICIDSSLVTTMDLFRVYTHSHEHYNCHYKILITGTFVLSLLYYNITNSICTLFTTKGQERKLLVLSAFVFSGCLCSIAMMNLSTSSLSFD